MPWLNSCCGEETQASSAPPHATARRGPPSAVQMIHTDSFSSLFSYHSSIDGSSMDQAESFPFKTRNPFSPKRGIVSAVDEAPPSGPRLYGPKKYGPKKL